MNQIKFWPSARIGEHVGDPAVRINSFLVNARSLDADQIAWTKNLSVFSIGSDMETTQLAVKQPDGKYLTGYIYPFLKGPLGSNRDTLEEVLAITVSSQSAIYGLQLMPLGGEQTAKLHKVVWLDIASTKWRVTQIKDGWLARRIENFK